MKKSAIYLGACAGILAIAGAFTTKNHAKVDTRSAWTIGASATLQVTCFNQSNKTCKTGGVLSKTLYSVKSGDRSGHTLRTGA
jgi:hypothetical protein